MDRIQRWYRKTGLTAEKLAARFFSIFFLLNTLLIWTSKTPFTDPAFLNGVNRGLFVLFLFLGVGLLTAAFCRVSSNRADKTVLFLCGVLFFSTLAYKANDVWMYAVICAGGAAVCLYCFSGKGIVSLRLKRPAVIGGICALGVIFAVAVGGLTALRYKMYISPNFDFGIFAQMFDYMKETGIPYTTCERDMLLSHFDVHVSFIYYLILPFYYLFSTPYTLNIAQAVILASGVIPLYLLCRRHALSPGVTLALSVVYVFYPALSAGCFYDIHENCFLTPLLLWLMVSMDSDSTVGLILSSLLVCFVKEDAPIYLMFIAIFMFFEKKKIVKPALLLIFSVGYFLAAVWYLDHHGDGAMLYRYANFSTQGGSIRDIVKACLLNPGYVFSQCLNAEKLEYLLKMLLPLGFLPLFSRKMHRYILLGPFMLINLMSYYPYQHSLDFQYNFGVAALLIYLTVVNLADWKPERRRMLAGWCALAALCGTLCFVGGRMDYIDYYKNTKAVCQQIDEVLESVPEDATVYANTFILPHLYENDVLYQLNADNPDFSGRTEYVVLDMRFDEFAALYSQYTEKGFVPVEYREGAAAVLYCPFYGGGDG